MRCLCETSVNITQNRFPLSKREKSIVCSRHECAHTGTGVDKKKYAHFSTNFNYMALSEMPSALNVKMLDQETVE